MKYLSIIGVPLLKRSLEATLCIDRGRTNKVELYSKCQSAFFLCCFLHGTALWPHQGALNTESPKRIFHYFGKGDLVMKYVFFLRISIIFCMRETVIISNGSRILPCLLGSKNDLKTMIYLFTFLGKLFF